MTARSKTAKTKGKVIFGRQPKAVLKPRKAVAAAKRDVLARCEPCRWRGKLCDGTCSKGEA